LKSENETYRSLPRNATEQRQAGCAVYKELGPGDRDRRQSYKGILAADKKSARENIAEMRTLGIVMLKPLTLIEPSAKGPAPVVVFNFILKRLSVAAAGKSSGDIPVDGANISERTRAVCRDPLGVDSASEGEQCDRMLKESPKIRKHSLRGGEIPANRQVTI
jgi:hypothetical protein